MRSGSSSILVQIQEDHQNEYQNRHSHIYKEFPDVLVNEIPPGEVSILPPVKLTIYPDSQPSYQQPYKLSFQQRRMVEEEVRRLLWHGYVQPSTSPWGSPVIFVPKKNGEMRMCIDYRILNTALVTERYPIPSISLYLEKAARYKYYSLIDLKEGSSIAPSGGVTQINGFFNRVWSLRIYDSTIRIVYGAHGISACHEFYFP